MGVCDMISTSFALLLTSLLQSLLEKEAPLKYSSEWMGVSGWKPALDPVEPPVCPLSSDRLVPNLWCAFGKLFLPPPQLEPCEDLDCASNLSLTLGLCPAFIYMDVQ